MKPVLLDTGVIVALLDRNERYHTACVEAMRGFQRPLVTCEAVIAESCYLLRGLSGAAETVLENVARGVFQVPVSNFSQRGGCAQHASQVSQCCCGFRGCVSDSSLPKNWTRGDIFTLDSDFRFYQWRRNRAFNLLVPLD